MFLTIITSVLLTLWVLLCGGLFFYHYIVEVVFDLPVSGESPCTAHATLKQLIKRLLQECLDLPSLARVAAEKHPAVPPDDTNETYEDLLATAILNKVITNSQNRPSSSANSVSSRLSTSSQIRDDKEYFFGEETLDSKWKTTDLDSTSVSSLEEWIHSDSSRGSTKYVDRLTLEIKQNIEELSGTDSDREEDENLDDKEYFRNASLIQDEKTNWYLQKRKFAGTHSPVPVPMLVPNPTNEVKVLIGDKEIDETSDLSDVGSEYGDTESLPGRNSILIESKTIIGGKNYLSNLLDVSPSDDETSGDSGVKEVKDGDFDDAPSKVTNEKDDSGLAPDDDYVEDTSILSTYSNTEKDTEYTERYASLPRTIMKSPTPKIRSKEKNKQTLPPEIKENEEQKSEIPKNKSVEEETLENGFDENNFPGSYSKKEREKWKHPIEMKNNPYSKENMEKRIKRSNSGVSSLFGSDYYVRQASCPAGTKKSLPKEEEDQSVSITFHSDENDDSIEVFKARPIIISDDDSSKTDDNHLEEQIFPEPPQAFQSKIAIYDKKDDQSMPMPSYMSEATSDSDLSYVNCYDVENSQIYRNKLNDITVEDDNNKSTPRGLSYVQKTSEVDENSNYPVEVDNNSIEEDKISIVTKETPTPKPRIFTQMSLQSIPTDGYKKATFSPSENRYKKSVTALRRHNSESDLLYDSFDNPPTVIPKRRDNTLISKIYSNPSVRNFALTARDQLPIQLSKSESDLTFSLNSSRLSNSTASLGSISDLVSENNYMDEKQKNNLKRSRENILLESSSSPIQQTMAEARNKFVVMEKNKSNIRQQPFKSPVHETNVEAKNNFLISEGGTDTNDGKEHELIKKNENLEKQEIEELKEKHLVASTLKSIFNVNLKENERNSAPPEKIDIETDKENMSVKQLRKMFEKIEDSKDRPICSLTARSLSSKTREKLKN